MLPLFTSQQAADIDRLFIEQASVNGYELMRRAAKASFTIIRNRWQTPSTVRIFAGSGNNGGDGYQLGRLLLDAGYRVELFAVGGAPKKDPAVKAYQAYRAANGCVIDIADLGSDDSSRLIVDAIFGSGLNREVTGEALAVIRHINHAAQPVIALDLPSGLSADTGVKLPDAVCAKLTVTFIVRKLGLYTCDAKDCCGEVIYDDLQVDRKLIAQLTPFAWLMSKAEFVPEKILRQNSHKGHYGHVLVVGGDYGMSGAVRLAGEAAMRCGAGLVSVATRTEHAATIAAACPVLMAYGVADTKKLKVLADRADVMAIGPGYGNSAWGQALFSCLADTPQYKVIDADALKLLAAESMFCDRWVLTPHPGEAAKLLSTDSRTVQSDRLCAAKEIVHKFGGICVLKGSGTIICSKRHAVVCPLGSAAMATAGMGDVLSGVVAALLAQSLPSTTFKTGASNNATDWLYTAVLRGVYLHALAAERAAGSRRRGVLASDLMPHLSEQFENVGLYKY